MTPWPQGTPENPPTAQQMLTYLDQLASWIDDRRRELDRLDRKIQASGNPVGTQDIAMTLTVWQAIKDRYTDLVRVWDSGRVGEVQLKQLAVMTWANLNDMLTPGTSLSTGGGLALSLPEACRMLEALVAQLSTRYQLGQVPTEVSARIAALLAQVERIRYQANLDPDQRRHDAVVNDLASDIKDMVEMANRGGDIGGMIGPLEVRAAHLERDLIVSHAEQRILSEKIAQIRQRRSALIQREQAVTDLVRKTVANVSPAPKYAVPHVEALGEIPTSMNDIDSYLASLEQVSAALDIVQQANEQANAHKAALIERMKRAQLARTDQLGADLANQIQRLFESSPSPLNVIEPLIAAYEASGRT